MDDPSLVTTAQPYKGQFPLEDNPPLSEKLNHAHNKYRAILENTLSGWLMAFVILITNNFFIKNKTDFKRVSSNYTFNL